MFVLHTEMREGRIHSRRGTLDRPTIYSSFPNHCEQYQLDPYKSYSTEDPAFVNACERMANLHFPYFRYYLKDTRINSGAEVQQFCMEQLEDMISKMFSKYTKQHAKTIITTTGRSSTNTGVLNVEKSFSKECEQWSLSIAIFFTNGRVQTF